MFEVDGASQRVYCENLSYISKMYLDHKNIHWTIEPFLFYCLVEVREDGYHFVGYFSKEKNNNITKNNLSCILVMPFCQRSGYGKLLIELSYALSQIENKPGGPERPISDLGIKAYLPFWTRRVVNALLTLESSVNDITLEKIIELTGMSEKDLF